jgi:nitroreductase
MNVRTWTVQGRQRLGHAKDKARIIREVLVDGRRHVTYAAAVDRLSALSVGERQLEAQITKDYHRIEKGLALREPRRGFGIAVAARLRANIPRYQAISGHDPTVVQHAQSALDALSLWHTDERHVEGDGPTRFLASPELLDPGQVESFFRSRASVRDFADRSLPPELIAQAAALALSSPSVCNRQAWGLWAFHDPATVQRLARLQNGSSGFRDQIPCLLVVTVDAQMFAGAGERNQRWIDGGLYAMSLVWALHALGVASCMLNWSVGRQQTQKLREAARIPDHMDVITMIAVGFPREGLRVARSPRRPVESVLHSDAIA